MFEIQGFTFTQMIQAGAELRRLGAGAGSMEEVANRVVQYLRDHLISKPANQKVCVLVRLFVTHPFNELDEELRRFATTMLQGEAASPTMKCLTLLATAGEKPEWNSRATSEGHKAIPLASESAVQNSPMISQLLSQLGLSFSTPVKPDPALMLDMEQSAFNVFHVPEAQGSPYVPKQQELVIRYGVKSVLGFGGLLNTGEHFAVILYSRVHISRESAERFKTLALSTNLALLSFAGDKVFA
jgi:hypothetical protein